MFPNILADIYEPIYLGRKKSQFSFFFKPPWVTQK